MATISKNWLGRQQHDWDDDSWTTGAPTTAAETLVGETESLTADIDLETSGYEGVVVTVKIDFDDTSPTDDVIVSFYGSVTQDGTYTGDEIAFFSRRVVNGNDPSELTFVVRDYLHFRIGFVQTGSTDTTTDVALVYYDAWNWSSA